MRSPAPDRRGLFLGTAQAEAILRDWAGKARERRALFLRWRERCVEKERGGRGGGTGSPGCI
eukprot:scaffold963_cov88-Isochrysis_galbana.AAC.2